MRKVMVCSGRTILQALQLIHQGLLPLRKLQALRLMQHEPSRWVAAAQ
jgi:hypothetical protein